MTPFLIQREESMKEKYLRLQNGNLISGVSLTGVPGEPLSLRERLARINTHTLSKKTTRLSQLLKQEAGLVPRVSNGLEEGLHASHPKGQDGAVVRWSLRLLSEMRRLRPERGRVGTLT